MFWLTRSAAGFSGNFFRLAYGEGGTNITNMNIKTIQPRRYAENHVTQEFVDASGVFHSVRSEVQNNRRIHGQI